jgi:CHAD domain-containing protein
VTVSSFLSPRLGGLGSELCRVLPRLEDADDTEAVHDLRVTLRRLRSLLRPARSVYGKFHTDAVRGELKAVADATSELRDEEVLAETLGALPLRGPAKTARDQFLLARQRRQRVLRGSLLAMVKAGAVAQAISLLEALLRLPVRPKSDPDEAGFAREVVFDAEKDVHALREVPLDDVLALHELRIRYKRLRYAVEGFADVLTPELSAMAHVAAKFQKRLGEVHDLDVALSAIHRARSLSPEAKASIVRGLQAARERAVARFAEERDGARQKLQTVDAPVVANVPPGRASAKGRGPVGRSAPRAKKAAARAPRTKPS